jgi:hypothetical protein
MARRFTWAVRIAERERIAAVLRVSLGFPSTARG